MRFFKLCQSTLVLSVTTMALPGCGESRESSASLATANSSSSTKSTEPTNAPRASIDPEDWNLEPPPAVAAAIASAQDDINVGMELFQHYCAVCHGPEGKGDGIYYSDDVKPKPADLTDQQIAGAWSDDHIATVVRDGSSAVGKSNLCPPWGRVFSDKQVAAIVKKVRQLATQPSGQ